MEPVTALAVGATVLSAGAAIQQGAAQAKLAEYQSKAQQDSLNTQAKQMEVIAGQERAAAIQKMIQQGKQKRIAQSRAQALAAAGGGGSLDPSVVNIIGDLEEEGYRNQQMALWEGEERAKDLEFGARTKRNDGATQAKIGKYAGQQYRTAGYMGAASTVLSNAANYSLQAKYGDRRA